MKQCCLSVQIIEQANRQNPKPPKSRKSPTKLSNGRQFDFVTFIETSNSSNKALSECESNTLNSIELSINYLRNTNKNRRKIKDAVMVRKIEIKKKEKNMEKQNQPKKINLNIIPQVSGGKQRVATQCKSSIFDSVKKNQSYFSPYSLFKKNDSDEHLKIHSKTSSKSFLKNQSRTKTVKLQNIPKKQTQQISQKVEKNCSLQPITKSQTILNAKIFAYLNLIKQIRKTHNFPEELPLFAKKRSLRVKIRKGNNSALIRELFKKRWWWTIDDDKQNKNRATFIWSQLKDKNFFQQNIDDNGQILFHNHFSQNQYLGNKKALFYNMSYYYDKKGLNTFEYLPLTFHVQDLGDESWKKFKTKFEENQENKINNIWILKPGENSNRGKGITVHKQFEEIQKIVEEGGTFTDGNDDTLKKRTFIIQSYIDKPFLYNKRKFDIRCFMLLVNINGMMKGYWYREGYIRTSSFEFQLFNFNTFVHLTNDAIQNNSQNYGKYEDGNKVSYNQFQKYLDIKHSACNYNFEGEVLPKMKSIALDSIMATEFILKGKSNRPVFQLFGLDFMIDEKFNPWLIEINTNPCIETSSLTLEKIIPKLLDDTFKLTIDILYPPPEYWPSSRRHFIPSSTTAFELIYEQDPNC